MIGLAFVVVLLAGWIIGFASCQSIDWYYRRKAARRHAEWERRLRAERELFEWNDHARKRAKP